MEYGRIIKRAVNITWRQKALWLFGILIVLFGGLKGGHGNFPFTYTFNNVEELQSPKLDLEGIPWRELPFDMPWGPGAPPWGRMGGLNWESIIPALAAIAAVVMILALIALIVRIVVGFTGQGALIAMIQKVEETETTSVRAGFKAGWSRFLRLFAIDLLISIIMGVIVGLFSLFMLVVGALLAVPAVACFATGKALIAVGVVLAIVFGLIWLLLVVLGGLALGAVATLVREFAFRACVMDQEGVFDAIGTALSLVRSRYTEGGLMWLLMAAIDFAVGLLMVPVALAAMAGVIASGAIGFSLSDALWGGLVGALPIFLVCLAAGTFFGGLYYIFRSAVWTLTYGELQAKA